MLQVNYVSFCCFLLSAVSICLSTNSIGEESVLVSNLLKGYNKHVKPTRQKTTAVNVSVTFSLSQIIDIDERDEQMTTTGFLVCMWHDELLRWNPADYNGAFRVVLPGHQIWLPEIAIYNTVAGGNEFALDSKFRVSVFSDGTVLWVPSMTWQTSCDMDLRRFPFDTQYCSVYIMNWVYGAAGVNYVATNDNKVALNAYQNSSEWELVDTSVFINSTDFNGMILPMMSFQLTLKRVPGYWVATIMFPSIILVVMSMLMFVMPVASQEKVSIGITALLSFFFIILMLADVCPRSSTENLPLLLFFIIITMGFSCLSIMLTMIVMNLQLQPRDTGVPRWVKALFLQKVARSLGVRPDGHISRPASVAPDKGHSNKVAPLPYGTGTTYGVKSSVPPTGHERTFEEIPMGEKVKQHLGREAGGGRNEIEELCEFLTAKAQRKELQRMMTEEWAMLAAVVDRILCIMFAIAIAITIVAVLVSILT